MKLDKRNGYFGMDSEWRWEGRHKVAGVWAREGCATITSILILTVVRWGGGKQNQKQITEATYLQPQTMIQRELWEESQQQGSTENT